MRKSWKALKLAVLEGYHPYYIKYRHFLDDRAVFARMYEMLREALYSLPDDPLCYIKCAMAHQLNQDFERMDMIIEHFEGRREDDAAEDDD